MSKLRVLSLFSGIGAFEKALTNIGIDHELVNYCEIDKHASKCYSEIHNVSENLNLSDITKIEIDKLPTDIGLITHGSPCQDFSTAGKQMGGDKGSGTRSSLIWNTVEIIRHCKPKYVIWENVKNALSKKHKHVVDEYIEELSSLGYNNYIDILNSKDYGIPQSRERVFIVSVMKECDNGFEFPSKKTLDKCLSEFIDFRECDDITFNFKRMYEEKIGCISDEDFKIWLESLPTTKGIGTKKMGLYDFNEMDTITTSTGLTGTLTCRNVQNYNKKFLYNGKLYKPSPRMCWKLMGFTDEDFDKCESIGKDKDLWNRAGNSIVVNVVEEILKNLLIK